MAGAAKALPQGYDLEALPTVAPGFSVRIFAREPVLSHPAALCFDRRGRLFVGHGPQFRAPTPETPGDSVVILEDRDGDGQAEFIATFAQGLNCVQGLAWKGDELWIANSPDLTIARDLDGDDVADEYEIVYDALSHLRHGLHGLNWGPDGKLYMSQGDSRVQPNAPLAFRELQGVEGLEGPDAQPRNRVTPAADYRHGYVDSWYSTEGGVLRCDEDGGNLELVARGLRNPWDLAFDDEFEWLGTDNDAGAERDRIFAPFQGAHFGHAHPWSPSWIGAVDSETVPATGRFPNSDAAAVGVVWSSGDAFPPEFRDVFLVGDWLGRSIYAVRREWQGARAVCTQPFPVLATARGAQGAALFRPTDMAFGPDGALYVLGWGSQYGSRAAPFGRADEQAEVNEGRVFRIAYDGPASHRTAGSPKAAQPAVERALTESGFGELVEDLGGAVPADRVAAQDELVRRGSSVVWDLTRLLDSGQLDPARSLWAAWAVGRIALGDHSIDAYFTQRIAEARSLADRLQCARILAFRVRARGLDEGLPAGVEALLHDPDPRARHAAALALLEANDSARTERVADALALESDPIVSYSLRRTLVSFSTLAGLEARLQDERGPVRRAALSGLLEAGAAGPRAVLALRSDVDPAVRATATRWLEWRDRAHGIGLAVQPAGGDYHDPVLVDIVGPEGPYAVRYTLDGTTPGPDSALYEEPFEIAEQNVALMAAVFVDGHRVGLEEAASFRWIEAEDWASRILVDELEQAGLSAWEILERGCAVGAEPFVDRDDHLVEVPAVVAGATLIRTAWADLRSREEELASFNVNGCSEVFVALHERVRREPAWLARSGFVATGETIRTEKASFRLLRATANGGRLTLGPNALQGGMYFAAVRARPPVQTEVAVPDVLPLVEAANPARGEELFFGVGACFACHRKGDRGVALGPDLTDLGRRAGPAEIARSILEPSATIIEGYQQSRVELTDGRTLHGWLRRVSVARWTLTGSDGKVVPIDLSTVVDRRELPDSVMPSNFGELFDAAEVADLVAWLTGPEEGISR